MKKYIVGLVALSLVACSKEKVFEMKDYGIVPECENVSPLLAKAMQDVAAYKGSKPVVIRFESGRYHFREEGSMEREYYISNHDQVNPKKVGMALEQLHDLTFDGQGAEFIFHGRMLPMSLLNSQNCTLKNFSIDFAYPHIVQVEVLENKGDSGIVFAVAPFYNYRVSDDKHFETFDGEQTSRPFTGIAFEPVNKHILYKTSDLHCDLSNIKTTAKSRILYAPNWKDERLVDGTLVTLRTYYRPAPAIFMSENKDVHLQNIDVHYAEGMGLLAQLCENIELDGFNVCLTDSTRCFTTQADATHFSGCKGKIVSRNGLYENMMDDAINVHGTYLKIVSVLDDYTVEGAYMHNQTWGFKWGEVGDSVQFVKSATMDVLPEINRIKTIKPTSKELKSFVITFEKPLNAALKSADAFGVENLTWTPSVEFTSNIVRNNRARGALFSTPCKVTVADNVFDHVAGTGVLLCGDCNGWYETGACCDVEIVRNTFVNSLTNLFQFTTALVSIYPEIPCLSGQTTYFHRNITIADNVFKTFDQPIVYAKSVDGLTIVNNKIETTNDYVPFHPNDKRFWFQRVKNLTLENNVFEGGFDAEKDVRIDD